MWRKKKNAILSNHCEILYATKLNNRRLQTKDTKPIGMESISTKQSEQQQRKGQTDKLEAAFIHYLPHDFFFVWEKLLENFLYEKLRNG